MMTTMTTPAQTVSSFFDEYSRALEHFDTKAMAYLHNVPCTLVSDETTTLFNDPGKLEGFFNMGTGFYRQFGIVHARPEVWSYRNWTDRIINARVFWMYSDHQFRLIYSCEYQYVLKLDKHDRWKIITSVSVNEKHKIEEWRVKDAGKRAKIAP